MHGARKHYGKMLYHLLPVALFLDFYAKLKFHVTIDKSYVNPIFKSLF